MAPRVHNQREQPIRGLFWPFFAGFLLILTKNRGANASEALTRILSFYSFTFCDWQSTPLTATRRNEPILRDGGCYVQRMVGTPGANRAGSVAILAPGVAGREIRSERPARIYFPAGTFEAIKSAAMDFLRAHVAAVSGCGGALDA